MAIFAGLENGDEDIFPDPASQLLAESRQAAAAKALEQQLATFVQPVAA